jgi:phage shock protein A
VAAVFYVLHSCMAHSSAELHQASEALVAYAKRLRGDAEQARRYARQCRKYADAALAAAKLWRSLCWVPVPTPPAWAHGEIWPVILRLSL